MIGVSDAAWRVLLLFAEALAPWGAPVEALGAGTIAVALGRLALVVALYVVATRGVRRATGRYPGVAALGMLVLFAAPVVSAVCSGDRGPLARGVWVMSPLVWATLAAIAAGPVADAVNMAAERRARFVLGAVVIAVGVGSLFAGRSRLASRDALWRSALAMDPANAPAAIAVAKSDDATDQRAAALDVLLTCTRLRPDSCACAEAAAGEAIDRGRYADARRLLDASDSCGRDARRIALNAEALIGTSALDDGEREAERAIQHDPDDSHGVYARAWATSLRGRPLDARADAERAVALGRGIPAELLLGTILYGAGDLGAADVQFQSVLREDPASVQATYDHALVADRQSNYHDAREGYLRTLQLDAKNADARYNLVLLTFGHGATLEAKHHFDVFQASYPGDGRIAQLRQMLAMPSPVKAMTFP
ncbi:MAG: tetratricopeptide repeat protein [Polyangiaceae bacterium]